MQKITGTIKKPKSKFAPPFMKSAFRQRNVHKVFSIQCRIVKIHIFQPVLSVSSRWKLKTSKQTKDPTKKKKSNHKTFKKKGFNEFLNSLFDRLIKQNPFSTHKYQRWVCSRDFPSFRIGFWLLLWSTEVVVVTGIALTEYILCAIES